MKTYLDNGATTMVDPKVVDTMLPFFTEEYGNASSVHSLGQEAKRYLSEARDVLANKLNAKFDEIIFTSGGTESDNIAIIGTALANEKKGKHIITTTIEHPAVYNSCTYLEKLGWKVTYLKVYSDGFVDVEKLKNLIQDDTVLVSIIHGNNEIGTIQDIESIGKICKENSILFHIDAVQSFTKTNINTKKLDVDLISMSSHKIHGPKGVGALYVRKGTKIQQLVYGGTHEFTKRPGTENVSGIVGFSKAVKLTSESHVKSMSKLRDYFIDKLNTEVDNIKINGPLGDNRLCNNINVSFANIEGEAIGAYLDMAGVCTSTGSACSSHSLEPSHVLLAINLPHDLANGTLRMTISRFTTKPEIDYAVEQIKKYVAKLRKVSPLKRILKKL